ncbi:hypothetical protein [Nonomuraea sp. NPDC050310]|uniref:hypothetical protein n=1 Tax=unclassified Nonomuraea TaxID=2593643 RepID=UPI0033CEB9DA
MTHETDQAIRSTARALITAAFTGEKELLDYVSGMVTDEERMSLADHVIDLHVMVVALVSDEPGLDSVTSDGGPLRPDHDLLGEVLVLAFYTAELLRVRFRDETVAWQQLRSLLLLDADQE